MTATAKIVTIDGALYLRSEVKDINGDGDNEVALVACDKKDSENGPKLSIGNHEGTLELSSGGTTTAEFNYGYKGGKSPKLVLKLEAATVTNSSSWIYDKKNNRHQIGAQINLGDSVYTISALTYTTPDWKANASWVELEDSTGKIQKVKLSEFDPVEQQG